MKVAILATASPQGEQGGAERFYLGLCSALKNAGASAEILPVVSDERDFRHVKESYLRFYDLDLSAFDGVISTKAPGYLVRHRNHICYLQHTMRVFYDMFDSERPTPSRQELEHRALVHRLDTLALQPPRTREIFTISHEVRSRLKAFNGLDSQVLYQASTMSGFRQGDYRYIFLPGRLHRWKRVDLVVRAMRYVRAPVELIISGAGEDEAELRSLAAGDPRIRFVGRVSDEALLELYADALAVAFVPLREDFGLVTLEAFHSHKPVITCRDSGEPARMVEHERTGFVCAPEPREIADSIDRLAEEPDVARRMGQAGADSIRDISWERVGSTLLTVLESGRVDARSRMRGVLSSKPAQQARVAVLDMQPIDPPVGGGRLRLLGLYHALGCPTTYVGTYDWRGEKARDHMLSATLREIDEPLSDEHHAAARELSRALGGKVVIDSAFYRHAHLSPRYHAVALSHLSKADVIVFSHPWLYPQFRDSVDRRKQLLVYDSHNVEGYLRHTLLDDGGGPGSDLCREVAEVESELCRDADIILACSQNDCESFHRLYDVPFERISVVPNGVFTSRLAPSSAAEKQEARSTLELSDHVVAIFIGSAYDPNVEAAVFIQEKLATALPGVTFVIAGGVGNALTASRDDQPNVRITGPISEDDKRRFLHAADLAINPMFSGSGTNIKMLEYMAAGLPIVTTPTGARGLRQLVPSPFVEASGEQMASAINQLCADDNKRRGLSNAARREAVEAYSWERISGDLGRLLVDASSTRGREPQMSVVIPTFDRPAHLSALMEKLERQTYRDFEVIVVDQSPVSWHDADKCWSLSLRYYHTDVAGAVNARNKGAFFARGDIIAFVDDDCLPDADWLRAAREYFHEAGVVGAEGLIVSDKHDDPNFRPVSNENFRGFGFMTANLFIRRAIFNALGGFDCAFDKPHFREDTDLAWRALRYGKIPFAENAIVFHPAHPRSIERESQAERVKFFEKDALLYKKHPERYKRLFIAESHWKNTPGFWEYFLLGCNKYGIDLDAFLNEYRVRVS